MKLGVICLIFLVTLSSVLSLTVERKFYSKKAKTHVLTKTRDGSGSWNAGFTCPRWYFENWVGSTKVGSATINNSKFYAGKMNANDETVKCAWAIETDSTNHGEAWEALFKTFGKRDGKMFYIYYKNLYENVNYYTWNSNYNKRLEGRFYNGAGNIIWFRLELPYAKTTNYLSDDEGRNIQNNINERKSTCQNGVLNTKTDITAKFALYKPDKELYNAASTDDSTLKAERAKKVTEKTNNIQKIFEASRDADALDETIKKDKETLKKAEEEKTTLEASYNAKDREKVSLATSLETAEKDIKDTAALKTKLEAAVKAALSSSETETANLKAAAPQRNSEVEASKAAILAIDSKAVADNLDKIVPIA